MLEMKNITKTFGDFKALDDLSMTVPKGAVYGLVGPNGAGKSTAIRHMTGVYRPDSGTVTVEGLPVYENPAVKSRIGYIPDDIFYFSSASLETVRGISAAEKGTDPPVFQGYAEAGGLPSRHLHPSGAADPGRASRRS